MQNNTNDDEELFFYSAKAIVIDYSTCKYILYTVDMFVQLLREMDISKGQTD